MSSVGYPHLEGTTKKWNFSTREVGSLAPAADPPPPGSPAAVRTPLKRQPTNVSATTDRGAGRRIAPASEAAEIDRGLFDGAGFDCKFHGRFRVSRTVLAQRKKHTRRQWEHALMLARARASEALPLISSELL
jgi:hypothetical protein